MTEPLRVLFVCTANICRSPYMELLADHLADGPVAFSSAGTHGVAGYPMDPAMAAPLLARGVPTAGVDSFRSKALTPDMVEAADVVLTAGTSHRHDVLEQHPAASEKVFTLGQLVSSVGDAGGATGGALVRLVAGRRPLADPALDVADPYRRGAEVARTCAQQVEMLLRVAVPALTGSGRISA